MELLLVIIVSLVGSLASLIGGLLLLFGDTKRQQTIVKFAVPFAAGALLAAAFVDLIPESLHAENVSTESVSWAVLGGIVGFFVLERLVRIFHHHHDNVDEAKSHSNASLIIIGDTAHNLLDGLAIGAAFLVDPVTGIIATIAVSAHEIPQEIGDFALLLSKGMSKRRVIAVNVATAVVTVVAAAGVYVLGSSVTLPVELMLAVTAGFFIYIAVSDIIPTIHAETNRRIANIQTAILLTGIVIVSIATTYAHGFVPEDEHHEDHATNTFHAEQGSA